MQSQPVVRTIGRWWAAEIRARCRTDRETSAATTVRSRLERRPGGCREARGSTGRSAERLRAAVPPVRSD